MLKPEKILSEVERYYSAKIKAHGSSPAGVDWNGAPSQCLRFDQLSRVISHQPGVVINDIGCGYGAYLDYLVSRFENISYAGFDISSAMIDEAKSRHEGDVRHRFFVGSRANTEADYSVASGIFNVRLDIPDDQWWQHIVETLDHMNEASRGGFSVNFLTSYSDSERMQPRLFYADPALLFTYCKTRYSRNVALLHDYGLYEFTILVRKDI